MGTFWTMVSRQGEKNVQIAFTEDTWQSHSHDHNLGTSFPATVTTGRRRIRNSTCDGGRGRRTSTHDYHIVVNFHCHFLVFVVVVRTRAKHSMESFLFERIVCMENKGKDVTTLLRNWARNKPQPLKTKEKHRRWNAFAFRYIFLSYILLYMDVWMTWEAMLTTFVVTQHVSRWARQYIYRKRNTHTLFSFLQYNLVSRHKRRVPWCRRGKRADRRSNFRQSYFESTK